MISSSTVPPVSSSSIPIRRSANATKRRKRLYEKAQDDLLDYARLPAVTKDHYVVEIGGNIEFIEEIPSAVLHGADGIGLYRTEFIYINREQLPDEEDHLAHYRSVVGVKGLSWATIRTFDLGGDKFFPDKKPSRELNPQLGLPGHPLLSEGGGALQGSA